MMNEKIYNIITFQNDIKVGECTLSSGNIYLQVPTDDPNDDIRVCAKDTDCFGTKIKLREKETGKEITICVRDFIDWVHNDIQFYFAPKKKDISVDDHVYFISDNKIRFGKLRSVENGNYTITVDSYTWMANPDMTTVSSNMVASEGDVLSFKQDENGGYFSYDIEDYKTHNSVSLLHEKHKG